MSTESERLSRLKRQLGDCEKLLTQRVLIFEGPLWGEKPETGENLPPETVIQTDKPLIVENPEPARRGLLGGLLKQTP